jgi:hypothetical protein
MATRMRWNVEIEKRCDEKDANYLLSNAAIIPFLFYLMSDTTT